jgi:hypothetical protein
LKTFLLLQKQQRRTQQQVPHQYLQAQGPMVSSTRLAAVTMQQQQGEME